MTEPLSQMIDALGLEIAALRKKGGGSRVEIRGGEEIGKTEGSWLYKFFVGDDLALRDDSPIRVSVGQEEVSGVIVSFRDGVLVIAIEKYLGPKIAFARLSSDESFLIEALRDRLSKVQAGDPQFNRQSAGRVLGLVPIRSSSTEPDATVFGGLRALNAEQQSAVRLSLGSDATFVWGPPGTGKTTTLARIVEAHYRAGRSVLVVSNTNIAVDTALERVCERLQGDTDFHQGLVIRQGPIVKEELRQRFGEQVSLEQIVARLGAHLRIERQQLNENSQALAEEERALVDSYGRVNALASRKEDASRMSAALAAERLKLEVREHEAADLVARGASLRTDLARARTMGTLRRVFSGLDPKKIALAIGESDRQANATGDAARALRQSVAAQEAALEKAKREVADLLVSTKGLPSAKSLQRSLEALRARIGEIRLRLAAIESELAALESSVVARCRILATTVYRTYLGKTSLRPFDVVVVDEASMLMPPLVYYVGGLASLSATIAGDFRQLPPIVSSDGVLAEEWLKKDVFELSGIPGSLSRKDPVPQLAALSTQYRMREEICDVLNRHFYRDHPLCTDPSANSYSGAFPLWDSALLYVDTTELKPWSAFKVGTYSRYNLLHGLLVRNLVAHLADVGYLPTIGATNDALGTVTPYASQSRLIQALLEDRLGIRAAGIAATVHRFQGNEKATMILDLTDSAGVPVSRFLKASRIEEDGARLLNVGLSRARSHVVLLANFGHLRSKLNSGTVVRDLLDHFQAHGSPLELREILPLAAQDWVDGLRHVFPAGFEFAEDASGAFTEGTFYPAFALDVARATDSIVVLSPFATPAGTSRWVDLLRTAKFKGVRVRVITRPPEEPGGGTANEVSEIIRGLRDLGVTVDLRGRMHEKIAIVDGKILWHGSLNILSHRDTHESMLRIASPAACAALGRFLSSTGKDGALSLEAAENPPCPACGKETVWQSGRFGIYFECIDGGCGHKVNAR